MPRHPEPGTQAKFKYQRAIFSHVEVDPGASPLLTADPWSYLTAHLLQRQTRARGQRRLTFERARFYAALAEGFYLAAEHTGLPTKGPLVYYAMLNLVKCFLAANGVPLEARVEHHGLTLPRGTLTKVRVSAPGADTINIFHEFSRLLGTSVQNSADIDLKDISSHVPESNRRRTISNDNWPRIYRRVVRDYAKFNLASLLTPEGYRYYCDLGDPTYHHLAYTLMLVYFIGTVIRYRPLATQHALESDLRPLITEAMAICPRQFLYQLSSKITASICSVPHASLI